MGTNKGIWGKESQRQLETAREKAWVQIKGYGGKRVRGS